MPFRRFLVWIHNMYLNNTKGLFLYSSIAFVLTSVISFLADYFLSWQQWAIIVRTVIVIPTAASAFVLGYGLVLLYVDWKTSKKPEYQTWRQKLSPTMRNRISILAGAVLFVLIFAVTKQIGYTFIASIIVAVVAGLFAFVRKTSKEIIKSDIGLPDSRDAVFDYHMRNQAQKVIQTRFGKSKKERKEQAQQEKEAEAQNRVSLERKLEQQKEKQ